jgi:hypothetical protein
VAPLRCSNWAGVTTGGQSTMPGLSFIRPHADGWEALTVFGVVIGLVSSRSDAELVVLDRALAVLAERWLLERPGHEEQVVCIQEASADGVTVALDFYSMPGVPTLRIGRNQLDSGDVILRLP